MAPSSSASCSLRPTASAPIEGEEGDEPAGQIAIPSAGVHLVGYRSHDSFVSQEAAKFEQYLAEEGLERVIAARAKRGESGKASRELFARCAKALLSAGPGPGLRTGFDRVLGFTLEIVPETDPESWQPGRRVTVRLLFAGRPLEGALVAALPKANPAAGRIAGRTDRAGRVALPLHAGGRVVHQGGAHDRSRRKESRLAEPLGLLNLRDPRRESGKRPPMRRSGLALLGAAAVTAALFGACRKQTADLEGAGRALEATPHRVWQRPRPKRLPPTRRCPDPIARSAWASSFPTSR